VNLFQSIVSLNRKVRIIAAVAAAVAVAVVVVLQSSMFDKPSKIETIRVGVLPGEGAEALQQRYVPLLSYLERETGLTYSLVIPASYGDLLRQFEDGKIDLANFGGLTFVAARKRAPTRPLVMRDLDTHFTSYFVASAGGPFCACKNLDCSELAGSVLSFGSRLSTSGHLMPRHFLATEKHLVPENVFSEVRYSGAHDQTLFDVRDGIADIGAVGGAVFRAMLRDGRLDAAELCMLWETPPYPDYVWAINDELDEALRIAISDAFLMLEKGDPTHAPILAAMRTDGFLPAGNAEFVPLERIADALGLLPPEDS
jgi:phosphonate transport system substrate-binding protein